MSSPSALEEPPPPSTGTPAEVDTSLQEDGGSSMLTSAVVLPLVGGPQGGASSAMLSGSGDGATATTTASVTTNNSSGASSAGSPGSLSSGGDRTTASTTASVWPVVGDAVLQAPSASPEEQLATESRKSSALSPTPEQAPENLPLDESKNTDVETEEVKVEKDEKKESKTLDDTDFKNTLAIELALKRGFLQPLTVIRLQRVCKWLKKKASDYFKHCEKFDFSYFFGVIGNFKPEEDPSKLDSQSLFLKFCSRFRSLKSVELRYCGNLKAGLLDRILEHLDSNNDSDEKPDPKNSQIEHLNLFFCYDLKEAVCHKLVKRLPNLRELNLGQCCRISEKTRHGLQSLGTLANLERLVLTIDPFLAKDPCWEIQALFTQKDNFPALKELDLQGSIPWEKFKIDLEDMKERFEVVLGPKYDKSNGMGERNRALVLPLRPSE